ncbi:hypothetical protein AC579_294 [Pseudocercospora musae]|uniref:Uncharacterized protein n=1 Tax=Pseudocercospora musae TaxID=113226 RepID=A0A139I9K5_9PEZI|nr:hypothetical protein AC579_294 [Pseudocercospora musae]
MSLSLPMIAPTVSSLEQDDVAIISTGSKMARFCTDEAAFGLDFGRGHRLVVGFHKVGLSGVCREEYVALNLSPACIRSVLLMTWPSLVAT